MIKPALTAEEWAKRHVVWEVDDSDGWAHIEDVSMSETDSLVYVGVFDDKGLATAGTYVDRYKCAALCLHGQPYGFKREHVEMLRGVSCLDAPFRACHTELNDLADRIAALLPPEDEDD